MEVVGVLWSLLQHSGRAQCSSGALTFLWSDTFIKASYIFLTVSDTFLKVSDTFLVVSDTFLIVSHTFVTVSDTFIVVSDTCFRHFEMSSSVGCKKQLLKQEF